MFRGHEDSVVSAAFSPDGLRLVTASEDQRPRLWNIATGTQLTVLIGHKDRVVSPAFARWGAYRHSILGRDRAHLGYKGKTNYSFRRAYKLYLFGRFFRRWVTRRYGIRGQNQPAFGMQ